MDCHSLLQGIFPTQGLNPALSHCRWIFYHLCHQGRALCDLLTISGLPNYEWSYEIMQVKKMINVEVGHPLHSSLLLLAWFYSFMHDLISQIQTSDYTRITSVSQSIQSLSRVWLFATPWIAARQASLSITKNDLVRPFNMNLLHSTWLSLKSWHRLVSKMLFSTSPPHAQGFGRKAVRYTMRAARHRLHFR